MVTRAVGQVARRAAVAAMAVETEVVRVGVVENREGAAGTRGAGREVRVRRSAPR